MQTGDSKDLWEALYLREDEGRLISLPRLSHLVNLRRAHVPFALMMRKLFVFFKTHNSVSCISIKLLISLANDIFLSLQQLSHEGGRRGSTRL